ADAVDPAHGDADAVDGSGQGDRQDDCHGAMRSQAGLGGRPRTQLIAPVATKSKRGDRQRSPFSWAGRIAPANRIESAQEVPLAAVARIGGYSPSVSIAKEFR